MKRQKIVSLKIRLKKIIEKLGLDQEYIERVMKQRSNERKNKAK